RRIRGSTSTADEVRQVTEALQGVDVGSRSNLNQIVTAISNQFGADSGPVLAEFLANVEASLPPRQPTQADRDREQRTLELMQVGRRGPYGQYGPGVVIPVVSQAARPLVPLVEAMSNLFGGAGAILSGLVEGLAEALDEDHRHRFVERLSQSSLLNV